MVEAVIVILALALILLTIVLVQTSKTLKSARANEQKAIADRNESLRLVTKLETELKPLRFRKFDEDKLISELIELRNKKEELESMLDTLNSKLNTNVSTLNSIKESINETLTTTRKYHLKSGLKEAVRIIAKF